MRLPRGVSGERLVRALDRFGYSVVRQKGSHVRLRYEGPPAHSVTVPMHDPLKVGTLHGIIAEVAATRSITVKSILEIR